MLPFLPGLEICLMDFAHGGLEHSLQILGRGRALCLDVGLCRLVSHGRKLHFSCLFEKFNVLLSDFRMAVSRQQYCGLRVGVR